MAVIQAELGTKSSLSMGGGGRAMQYEEAVEYALDDIGNATSMTGSQLHSIRFDNKPNDLAIL